MCVQQVFQERRITAILSVHRVHDGEDDAFKVAGFSQMCQRRYRYFFIAMRWKRLPWRLIYKYTCPPEGVGGQLSYIMQSATGVTGVYFD